MQPITRTQFLHNVGYGAIALTIEGSLALAPLVAPGKLPPAARSAGRFGGVDAQAQALLEWYHLPGVALGLISDGKLIYARGYGVQAAGSSKPMSEHSMFTVASLSKMFTSAAVMQLVETGAIRLDDPYIRHVPSFRMADPRCQDITIRHLLSHTAGLPETPWNDFYHACDDSWDDDDAAQRLVREMNDGRILVQGPGNEHAEFLYNGIGYDILAALIQNVTGELFEDYQRRHLLDPLRMTSSSFRKSDVRPYDLAMPHVRDLAGNPLVREPYPYARQFAPDRGFITNVVELSHYLIALMNGGWFFHRVLQPQTVELLWTPMYQDPIGWPGTGYACGCFITSYAQEGIAPVRMLFSLGGTLGFCAHITLFPEQGAGAITFVNLRTSPADPDYSWGICDKLAIQLLNGEI